MSRRTDRIASLIQDTIGQLILTKLSDPRVNPALTSVTHVEVPEDLLSAKVYISVMGTEAQQKLTLEALKHASGHIQELMAREITLRNTPILNFINDVKFKKALQTYELINKAMDEIRHKEAQKTQEAGGEEQKNDELTKDE
jgi:ribosome-binding factor A